MWATRPIKPMDPRPKLTGWNRFIVHLVLFVATYSLLVIGLPHAAAAAISLVLVCLATLPWLDQRGRRRSLYLMLLAALGLVGYLLLARG